MEMDTIIELNNGEKIRYSSLLNKMATSIFCESAMKTTTNNWCTYEEEVTELIAEYEVETELNISDLMEDLVNTLIEQYGNQVSECYVEDQNEYKCINLSLWDSFCVQYVDYDACLED
jgi:hypothetical protein